MIVNPLNSDSRVYDAIIHVPVVLKRYIKLAGHNHSFLFPKQRIAASRKDILLHAMVTFHQFFIIALVGERHRCLVAAYHFYKYGVSAIKTSHSLVEIYSTQANRLPLLLELHQATQFFSHRHEEKHSDNDKSVRDKPVPFPFIATSLITGTSVIKTDACLTVPDYCLLGPSTTRIGATRTMAISALI